MALLGMDAARNNLLTASNSYADIQRQLDRYNKVFETYANASPETQIRAASVMRQALNEYNGLKKQQEENAIKIYEAQQRVDYYNRTPQKTQSTQSRATEATSIVQPTEQVNVTIEQVPVITTSTPGTLNNNAPTTNVEVNTIDTNKTMNASNAIGAPKSTVNPTAPIGSTPKYPNTTISPVNTTTSTNINWPNYGPGSVVSMPGTGGIAGINSLPKITYKSNSSNGINTLKRRGNKYIIQPILRRIMK